MTKKKILYITGSRADFGRASYLLRALQEDPKFDLYIAATSMHLASEFGYTIQEIEEEFQIIKKVDALLPEDSKGGMVKSFGQEIIGLSHAIEGVKPDLVLVLGDRGEMLAGAIGSKHFGIPVAHIGGGHRSGSIDDKIRDAITVFSDLHLVATKKCKKRVISLGADPSKTFIVGAPDLEAIKKLDFLNPDEVAKRFNRDLFKPLILLSYHPTVGDYEKNEEEMKIICESIVEFEKIQVIATYPNADAGGRRMIEILEEHSVYPQIEIYKHIPYSAYLGLMNIAGVIVGNSSAGIIEAPSFGLPAVNIGSRQSNRERAENVIDIECGKKKIVDAITMALFDEKFKEKVKRCKTPYGNGQTSQYVIKVLENYFSLKGKSNDKSSSV